MPAYYRNSVVGFLNDENDKIISRLISSYTNDGFLSQYTSASIAWTVTLSALRQELKQLLDLSINTASWQLLLEFPLYRLRRRIDAVILSPNGAIVIELKTGAFKFDAVDKRQAIEYAQDLRDFHAASKDEILFPVLWALEAEAPHNIVQHVSSEPGVREISMVGRSGLAFTILKLVSSDGFSSLEESEAFGKSWENSSYDPVPSVIDAAVSLFAGHSVRDITVAGARNLSEAANAVFSIISNSRNRSIHSLVFLTGVPGSGKTLAGLNIVHGAIENINSSDGDIVYLSGNTPLVLVLREALSLDQHARNAANKIPSILRSVRLQTRATIHHINDFLKQYVQNSSLAPSGHVIIFDEAQRAWDAKTGEKKFKRSSSEPALVLEIMARHKKWSVTVCLVGLGQEINDGEDGIGGWADAIERVNKDNNSRWEIFGPEIIFGETRSIRTLGPVTSNIQVNMNDNLHLEVPMRSFRSPKLGQWIDAVLQSNFKLAGELSHDLSYPLFVTRDLEIARSWLNDIAKGERRKGLLASSGARRLRADGIGEILSATDGDSIAHWFLKPPGDIRSSHALEVPANEYTSQGLEVDFGCLCWGGDLIIKDSEWTARRLVGNRWNEVSNPRGALYVLNSYRVLLSRAREGMIIWIPRGDITDSTRKPAEFNLIFDCFVKSGCVSLDL